MVNLVAEHVYCKGCWRAPCRPATDDKEMLFRLRSHNEFPSRERFKTKTETPTLLRKTPGWVRDQVEDMV